MNLQKPLVKISDISRYLYPSGIDTHEILWRTSEKAAVRYNGHEVILMAADVL